MPLPPFPSSTVEPLLRGSYSDTGAVFEALKTELRPGGMFHLVARDLLSRTGSASPQDVQDLASDTLEELVISARRQGGLARPSGWPPDNARPWLLTVVRSKATDCLRRRRDLLDQRGRRRGEEALKDRDREEEGGGEGDPQWSAVEDALETGELSTLWLLGIALLSRPSRVTRDLVERAAATIPRGKSTTETGLARPIAETWDKLRAWRERHGEGPDSGASRLELAWILRSSDGTSPQAWRMAFPEEHDRARDLLRKWQERGVKRLQALVKEGGEP